MNKLTFALGVTTVVFASTTVYFARGWQQERERAAQAPAMSFGVRPALPPTAAAPAVAEDSGRAAPEPKPLPAEPVASSKEDQIAFSKARLARLTDPRGRSEQLANMTAVMRGRIYSIARSVGWSREEIDRVATMQAERRIQNAEARARCDLVTPCTPPATLSALEQTDREDMVQLLGEAKVAHFDNFLASTSERSTFGFMRDRLSEGGPLSDAQEERFVMAIAEENRRFYEVARAHGVDIMKNGVTGAEILSAGAIKTAEGRASMIESATEYARHMHDRAAEILTPAQLVQFDDMQEETLRSLREDMKIRDMADAARDAEP